MAAMDTVEFNEIKGNLFDCKATDALVHCISQDLVMGKGIAKEFKTRFGGLNSLKLQKKKIGQVATLFINKNGGPFQGTTKINKLTKSGSESSNSSGVKQEQEGRFIYYMITKARYFQKPALKDFSTSLVALKNKALTDNVKVISMPRIGCGLDKLQWSVVRQLILDTFKSTGITINVYSI